MRKIQVLSKSVACENGDSVFKYFGWPTVARLADGTLAMACSGFRLMHICPFGKGVISYSRDEGKTWTHPAAVIDTPLDDRDSGIVPFGDGRAIFTSFNNTLLAQRNWNRPRYNDPDPSERAKARLIDAYCDYVETLRVEEQYIGSTYRISEDGGYTFGAIRRSPVTAPHGPCRLLDGSLLYVGYRFSADDSFTHPEKPFVEVWHMAKDADTFEYVTSLVNVYDEHGVIYSCEPHAIQLPDGRIVAHIRVERGDPWVFTIYQSVSEDGGKTFSKPVPLLTPCGGSPAHLLLHSSGTLISAYGYRVVPFGIRVMLSEDGGRTWEKDIILEDESPSADLGYPASVELKDGSILTVFYENQNGASVIRQIRWKL